MTFTVEVLLKGTNRVVARTLTYTRLAPHWNDEDVRSVLLMALRTLDEVRNPDVDAERHVALRGLSWIVTPVETGVAIAVEIPSGAVVAGPFDIGADELTQAITRVLAGPSAGSGQLH